MPSFAPVLLSGSTNGKPIKVAATATTGTTIHTAIAGTSDMDEIFLYAFNSDSVSRTLTIEFGGTTAPDQNIVVDIPSKQGLYCVVPGLKLQNGLAVTAFASAANVITISGYVNRYTAA